MVATGERSDTRSRLELFLSDRGTVGSDVATQRPIATTELTVSELGFRRALARFNLDDADVRHQDGHFKEWTDRTSATARLSTAELLEKLADLGFAWRDIAGLLGVSVQAIQKWRKGAPASADNRSNLAGVLAACELITDDYGIQEVASWFEIPIHQGVPVTPLDLWMAGRPDLIFDYAGGHCDAESALTNLDPEWRERYRDAFETFRAGDGQLALRMKDDHTSAR